MSTLRTINVVHPSGTTTNIVNDASGNVAIGNNLTFSGTGARITGDFSNATQSNLVSFQTSTANAATSVSAIPNGTNNVAAYTAFNSSSPNNSSYAQFYVSSAATTVDSGKVGTGTYLPMTFSTGGAERMRIDTSGVLMVGTTSLASGRINTTSGDGLYGLAIKDVQNNNAMVLFLSNAGSLVGQITSNSTNTAYQTSSDYRLKENVQPMTGALGRVSALKPVTYDWKVDGSDGEGFIAHELQSVIPHSVFGEKDAVNKDGSIKPQGVDYSKVVVHLVAAIQELEARLAALEAKG